MRYRPEIDGLRAVAVLPVILYHAGLPGVPGGFIGVDVFFVISGYLITSVVMEDIRHERFSILTFYERRARRLLPAFTVVLVGCMPFAWAWMIPSQLENFLQSAAAACLFVSNIFFWWGTDYFESGAEREPLLHTWSLAVEEQFYLLFPLLLLGLRHLPRRSTILVLGLLAVLSFALCLLVVRVQPAASFYLASSRAWELAAGSLCALSGPRQARATDGPLALAGLLMILGGVLVIKDDMVYPSQWTLLPVAGASLVVLFAHSSTLCGRLLTLGPAVWIGLASYSAYLIHQPLFAFARIRAGLEPPLVVMLALALLSLILGRLSWRFVEAPFRVTRPRALIGRSVVFAASGAVIVLSLGLGVAGTLTRGWEGRFPAIAVFVADAARQPAHGPCTFDEEIDAEVASDCLGQGTPGDTVVLLGDSHASAVATAMQAEAEAAGLRLISMTHSACFPVPGTVRLPLAESGSRSCAEFLGQAFALLDQAPGVPVVLFTRWTLNLEGTRFDNGEGGKERGHSIRVVVDGAEAASTNGAGLARHVATTLRTLSSTHPLVLVGPYPEAGWNVPELAASQMLRGLPTPELSTSSALYRTRNASALALLGSLRSDRVTVVELGPMFCDTLQPGRCLNNQGMASFYSDDDHPGGRAPAMIAAAVFASLRDLDLRTSGAGAMPGGSDAAQTTGARPRSAPCLTRQSPCSTAAYGLGRIQLD